MKIHTIRVRGIRCFDDTGAVELSDNCNVFVGQNNCGKSTILKSVLGFQIFPFSDDGRPGASLSQVEVTCSKNSARDMLANGGIRSGRFRAIHNFEGSFQNYGDGIQQVNLAANRPLFYHIRPNHTLVPFLAKRKAYQFDQNVTSDTQNQLQGTLQNLYSRIDLVATAGHPRHEEFLAALNEVVGLPITTRASKNGKEAGFYLSDDKFIPLDRMGDGVAEMVALIVELCLERNKIFILEEPETNLHPKGLKALLEMVRRASNSNQFLIATHSNIVVRELGSDERTNVFRVFRDEPEPRAPSHIELVPREPAAHTALLRELGYEFSDVGLYEAWLFLEESSAEQVINEVLVPHFAAELKGRLRTFAAGGVSQVEPGVAEFQRLVVFVHLQPAYEGRLWIRVDAGTEGERVVQTLREKFEYLNEDTCNVFSQLEFERYYPAQFQDRVTAVFAITSKKERQAQKASLLREVLDWSRNNPDEAKVAWAQSASEPIELLKKVRASLE